MAIHNILHKFMGSLSIILPSTINDGLYDIVQDDIVSCLHSFFSLLRVAFDLSFLLDGGLDIFCLSGSFRFDNCTTLRLVVITDTIINLRELTKWIEK